MDTLIADRIKCADRTTWREPQGTHTRYLVVDDLLPKHIAYQIAAAFPVDAQWHQHSSFRERKKSFAKLSEVDPLIGQITDAFHKLPVLKAVQEITGITELEADPSLYAGGISMMSKGDFLNPHIDNSHDAGRKRYRRLNLLYYVSTNWPTDFGGNLELWDTKVKVPVRIHSAFNRLVIMETNRNSYHSVEPVRTSKNRCCMSNYFFSEKSPEEKNYYHVTSFLGRPDEKLKRYLGHVDNSARKFAALVTGKSRGRNLTRY